MNLPDFILPWMDRFYDSLEIELLQILKDHPLNKETIIEHLAKKNKSKKFCNFDVFLERAWRRGVIKILNKRLFAVEDFHVRFDYWALFEGWKDLPVEIKDKLNNWELNYYISTHGKRAEELKKGQQRDPSKIYPEYLLLDEVEALFNKIPKFYLWPCNCRSMMNDCHQSKYTCIRFSNDRGLGWEISKEKALEIVKSANKKGLMQSAELGLDKKSNVTGALCNCCNDCCFPHQLSNRLNVIKYWPMRRYVARPPTSNCTKCGKCVRRCPFNIIFQEKNTKQKQIPVIDVDLCRGCGVCSTECPEDAIEMKKISESVFEDLFQA